MNIDRSAIRQLYKNLHTFEKKVWTRSSFVEGLYKCMRKYNPHSFEDLVLSSPLKDGTSSERSDAFSTYKERQRTSWRSVSSLSLELQSSFFKDVCQLARDSDLGDEWLPSLVSAIIDHWFFPPIHNLHIQADEEKKRVVLELNPDTSLDDIKLALAEIQYLQKKLNPKFKKSNFTDKSFKKLTLHKKDRLFRAKKHHLSSNEDIRIMDSRTKDADIVADIWANAEDEKPDTDRKRISNLRQIRSRMKRA